MKKTTTITILAIMLVFGGIILFARPSSQNKTALLSANSNISLLENQGQLIVEEANNYDFGTISMAAGNVKHAFKIRNTGNGAVIINKMYTSCMCTTATLMMGNKQYGPYGMPGHGSIPKIGQAINPNEEAIVEVIFDPAAHGPAGVGRIQRTITIENSAGQPVELMFSAVVAP